MSRIKNIIKTIFNPPPLWTLFLALLGFGSVLAVPVLRIENSVYRYIAYTFSAYALVITVTGLKYLKPFFRSVRNRISETSFVRWLRSTPLGKRYFGDLHFRMRVSLNIGLTVNICYIIIKLYTGIRFRSAWFLALAVYYILLAAMRLVLVRYSGGERHDIKNEFRLYRICGIILLLMNQSLAGIVTFIVYQNRGFSYPGYLIYAMAFYSFYAVITAVVNTVKARKHQSPVLSAAKAVSLVAALVSLLSLTTAMLAQFGSDDSSQFNRSMTASVGGGVCTAVIIMAIYMIRRATKNIKSLSASEAVQMSE